MLEFFSDFYSDFDKSKATSLLRDLELDPEDRFKTLSKGNKEKYN